MIRDGFQMRLKPVVLTLIYAEIITIPLQPRPWALHRWMVE